MMRELHLLWNDLYFVWSITNTLTYPIIYLVVVVPFVMIVFMWANNAVGESDKQLCWKLNIHKFSPPYGVLYFKKFSVICYTYYMLIVKPHFISLFSTTSHSLKNTPQTQLSFTLHWSLSFSQPEFNIHADPSFFLIFSKQIRRASWYLPPS